MKIIINHQEDTTIPQVVDIQEEVILLDQNLSKETLIHNQDGDNKQLNNHLAVYTNRWMKMNLS